MPLTDLFWFYYILPRGIQFTVFIAVWAVFLTSCFLGMVWLGDKIWKRPPSHR